MIDLAFVDGKLEKNAKRFEYRIRSVRAAVKQHSAIPSIIGTVSSFISTTAGSRSYQHGRTFNQALGLIEKKRALRVPRLQANEPKVGLAMPDLRGCAPADRDIKDAGGERWAILASLIETAKMSGINPEAWLTDVLTRLAGGHRMRDIDDLLPWHWPSAESLAKAA